MTLFRGRLHRRFWGPHHVKKNCRIFCETVTLTFRKKLSGFKTYLVFLIDFFEALGDFSSKSLCGSLAKDSKVFLLHMVPDSWKYLTLMSSPQPTTVSADRTGTLAGDQSIESIESFLLLVQECRNEAEEALAKGDLKNAIAVLTRTVSFLDVSRTTSFSKWFNYWAKVTRAVQVGPLWICTPLNYFIGWSYISF